MRILFLHRFPLEKITGGVAEYLHYLPLSLNTLGIEPYMYSEGETAELSGPTVLPNGIRAYTGPFIKPGLFISTKKLKPVIELCKKENIDLVHAQSTYRFGYLAMQIYKRTRIPYIITSHADIVTTNSDRMKRKIVQRRCKEILRHAKKVTHLTPLMAEFSHQILDTRQKSVIISNGIDTTGWDTFAALPTQNYLICLGRLEPEKGFHILIDAFARLRQQGVRTSLVIAGTGSAESALQEQAKRLKLPLVTQFNDFAHIPSDSVIFTGYVRGDAKKRLIAQSQMVLFPTQPNQWEEAFSIVQVESMAAGKALLASDSAPTRYLQSLGLQAILISKADDAEQWAEQIAQLLNNTTLCNALGKMNLENARQFDWNIIAKQYHEVYRGVCYFTLMQNSR